MSPGIRLKGAGRPRLEGRGPPGASRGCSTSDSGAPRSEIALKANRFQYWRLRGQPLQSNASSALGRGAYHGPDTCWAAVGVGGIELFFHIRFSLGPLPGFRINRKSRRPRLGTDGKP